MMSEFPYRLDTNYAKMDRIENREVELFKKKILLSSVENHSLEYWQKLFLSDIESIEAALEEIH